MGTVRAMGWPPGNRTVFAPFTPLDLAHVPEVFFVPAGISGDPIDSWDNAGSAGQEFVQTLTKRPPVGTIGGVNCADYDGSNDQLDWTQVPAALRLQDALTAAQWHFFGVVNVDAIATNAAAAYDNDTIIGDAAGYWTVALKTGNVIVGQWDGVEKNITSALSLSTDTLIEAWYDGADLHLRVGAAAEATPVAAGNITTVSSAVSMGQAYGSHYMNGRAGGLLVSKVAYSGADQTNIRDYYAALYGVAV